MKVVVAGGSGALGRRLCADLDAQGHEVVVLTRRARPGAFRQVEWDGRTVGPWSVELAGSAVVNLAGELVDRRPTAAGVDLLTTSRVEPTRALVEASSGLDEPVRVWVQASTLAIYGDAGDEVLDESAEAADGPPQMAGVAKAWEAAASGAHTDRLVTLRTGIVLDNDTPALDRLLSLARWGLGGRVGPGTQWVSWIHIEDWLAILRAALRPEGQPLSGIVHATGPRPVTNAELMAALRRSLGRPPAPPTPAALKVTNKTGVRVRFLWGALDNDKVDGLVTVGRKPKVIDVRRPSIIWAAFSPLTPDFEIGAVRDIRLPRGVDALPPGAPTGPLPDPGGGDTATSSSRLGWISSR